MERGELLEHHPDSKEIDGQPVLDVQRIKSAELRGRWLHMDTSSGTIRVKMTSPSLAAKMLRDALKDELARNVAI